MFDHIPKRARTGTSSKGTVNPPPINIYLSPLGDISQQHINRAHSRSPPRKRKAFSVKKEEGDTVIILSD